MTDIPTTVPPPNVDGLAWKRQFAGDDARPDWEWRHFDLVHAQARVTIEDDAEFPVFAKALINGTDESLRVVSDGNVVEGVLPTYARTGDVDQFELTFWHFAMLPHALITGRRRPSRTLANMWEAVAGGLNPTGPANLVDRCLAEFAREVRARLTTLAATLDPVEDTLIEMRNSGKLKDLGQRLGIVRREAIRLNRMLVPIVRAFDEDDRTYYQRGQVFPGTMWGIVCCTARLTTSSRCMTVRARCRMSLRHASQRRPIADCTSFR